MSSNYKCNFLVTHTSKLMMHNHDNILSLFCISGEVDDCVLQFQKTERFD